MIIDLYIKTLYIGIILGVILLISMLAALFCIGKYIIYELKIYKYFSIILFIIFITSLIFLVINNINLDLEYLKYFF